MCSRAAFHMDSSLELVKPSLIWGIYRAVFPSDSADYRVIVTLIDSA